MGNDAGGRIRALRGLYGLTQMELANRVGMSQGQLSKIERGEAPATIQQLELIAEVAGVPTSFMAADPVEIDAGSLRFRKASRIAKRSETNQIAQLTIEAYRVCTDLATRHGLRPPDLPQAPSETPSPDEIEDLAVATRRVLGLAPSGPVPHITRVSERAGIFVVPLRLPNAEPDARVIGHDGVSTWRAFFDPALMGYLPNLPGDRLRHTLGHELGHLVLHQPHPHRPPSRQVEQEAHHFAGAFLVPRDAAIEAFKAAPAITLERLKFMKAGWGMAIQALIMRAWHIGMIDETRRAALFKQLSQRGWRKHEPVTVHPERPLLLRKVLEVRYGSPIDWHAAAQDVGLSGDILRGLAGEPHSRRTAPAGRRP